MKAKPTKKGTKSGTKQGPSGPMYPEIGIANQLQFKSVLCCGEYLKTVSNGLLGTPVGFCPECKSVYALKLVKVPRDKISQEFIVQSLTEVSERKLPYV